MTKPVRDSSLELYRIIVMLAIVAHHYLVCSGLYEVIKSSPVSVGGYLALAIGGWGKVGINCFLLITGYYMCMSKITAKKFIKLYFEIVFYYVASLLIFHFSSYHKAVFLDVFYAVFPINGITSGWFVGAFLVFWLTIPFLNAIVNNISKVQHLCLIVLTVAVFSVMPLVPRFGFEYNHVEWFAILYFIGSYIRKYPNRLTENRSLWIGMSICSIIAGLISLAVVYYVFYGTMHKQMDLLFFLRDSNKISALMAALCFFLCFKPQNTPLMGGGVLQPYYQYHIIGNIWRFINPYKFWCNEELALARCLRLCWLV